MFRLFILIALLSSEAALAGILFDPYVGYAVGSLRKDGNASHPDTATQTVDSSGSIDGMAYGARAAWMFGRFFLGGEYQGIRATVKLKDSTEESAAWNSSAIFGIMGWQFFTGFRLYGGITVRPYEATEDTSPEATKFEGSARKIGVGYRYRVPAAINIEYVEYSLGDVEYGGTKGKVKDYYDKLNYNTVLVNVSFPFEIGSR